MGGDLVRTDFCVYTHHRPDGSVFYVGKGVPQRPYRKTMRNAVWIQEVAKIGTYDVKIVWSGLPEIDAFEKERQVISELLTQGAVLVNQTLGGDGCKSVIFTDDIRNKIKAARALQTPPMQGKALPESAKQKLSVLQAGQNNPMFGRTHTDETKEKFKTRPVAKHWAGKVFTDAHKAKMSKTRKAHPSLECPHCGKVGGYAGMKRHHFTNCKSKETLCQ
jgi:hypothetical protein